MKNVELTTRTASVPLLFQIAPPRRIDAAFGPEEKASLLLKNERRTTTGPFPTAMAPPAAVESLVIALLS